MDTNDIIQSSSNQYLDKSIFTPLQGGSNVWPMSPRGREIWAALQGVFLPELNQTKSGILSIKTMFTRLYKRLQAWMLAKFDSDSGYEELMAPRKKKLFSGLKGTLVEIGPGAGANLHFYPRAIHWIGIEPNEFMHPYINGEAAKAKLKNYDIMAQSAERLPFPDNSIDVVVSTLVLCTVSDQNKTLKEIHRILKPGGKFIFVEHIAARKGSWMRLFQTIVKPAWKVIADGCHPDRDTLRAIRQIKFHQVKARRFQILNTFVSPHVAGVAIK